MAGKDISIPRLHQDAFILEGEILEIERILKSVDGIGFVYLSESDVVRHRLVKEIIRAYAELGNGGNAGSEGGDDASAGGDQSS